MGNVVFKAWTAGFPGTGLPERQGAGPASPPAPARIGRPGGPSSTVPARGTGRPPAVRAAGAVQASGSTAPLPHWEKLAPGRPRDYAGHTYDPAIVKRVYVDEVHAWEHHRATSTLVDLARRDAWEDHAVPPIHLAYSEKGVETGNGRVHYAVQDGHHRLAAIRGLQAPGGGPASVPAMVTSRWTTDASGRALGYRGMPFIEGDPTLPQAWNRGDRPLVVHMPESIEHGKVWGVPQLKLMLPGSLASSITLADVAERLNAYQRPNEFLHPDRGDLVIVRVSLSDVHGREGAHGSNGTLHVDIRCRSVDPHATDWKALLRDEGPLRQAFTANRGADYPLLEVRVQQHPMFIEDDL